MKIDKETLTEWLLEAYIKGYEHSQSRHPLDRTVDLSEIFTNHPSAVKSDPLSISNLPFDESKCGARLKSAEGLPRQCSCRPFLEGPWGDQKLCKTHINQFSKYPKSAIDSGTDLTWGRYDQPRPDKELSKWDKETGLSIEGPAIKWNDTGEITTTKKNTTKKTRVKKSVKASVMREHLSSWGITHHGLKGRELTEKYELEKINRLKVIDESSHPEQPAHEQPEKAIESETQPEQPENLEELEPEPEHEAEQPENLEELEPEHEEQPENVEELEPEPEPETEPETETEQPSDPLEEYKVIQSYESDGRKYEVEIHTPNPHDYQNDPKTKDISKLDDETSKKKCELSTPEIKKFFQENKSFIEENGFDVNVKGRIAHRELWIEITEKMEQMKLAQVQDITNHSEEESDDDEKTVDMSSDEEDAIEYVDTAYEEVDYLEDEDSDRVFNMSKQHVGDWDENGDIRWINDSFRIAHQNMVEALQ